MYRIKNHTISMVSQCSYPLCHGAPWWMCVSWPTGAIVRHHKQHGQNIEHKFTTKYLTTDINKSSCTKSHLHTKTGWGQPENLLLSPYYICYRWWLTTRVVF